MGTTVADGRSHREATVVVALGREPDRRRGSLVVGPSEVDA
jgi:hypothetical protein